LGEARWRLARATYRFKRTVWRHPKFSPLDPFKQIAKMGRGVNILGYDPMWDLYRPLRFRERHFKLIRDAGFQTVRVNLQAFRHMDDEDRLSAKWFRALDWIVGTALDHDLHVILDQHDFKACDRDLDAFRRKLRAFWTQIAGRYKNAPNSLIFELLNEPNSKVTPEVWNALLEELLQIVRQTNPSRNIVIGPAGWNTFDYLDQLRLPSGDRNIIVTVHYYLPMDFTHQGAFWNPTTAGLSDVTWGIEEEKRRVADDFNRVQQWAARENRPVLLGEFGAYGAGPMDSRVCYTSHVARTAERLCWAWTYWQFDSNFVLWDMDRDAWVQPILKALVP